MNLFLSPHDDDNALFGAFTCMREKPLVVVITDAFVQSNRGEVGCDSLTRAKETLRACDLLGCSVVRLGIRDDMANETLIRSKLENFQNFDRVYAPAMQGGNPHHDMVARVAKDLFSDRVIFYTTYTRTELHTRGNKEVIPSPEELNLKNKALNCYVSQINLRATKPHFDAVVGKSEWLL